MHTTRGHCKKCKTLGGVDPLNKIAAGMFLINGLLFYNHTLATVTASVSDTNKR